MSDTPPGPGWWIASDGRWYPPEAHPSAVPPAWSMPPPVPSYPPASPYPPVPGQSQWSSPPGAWGGPPPGWGGGPPPYGYPPPAYAVRPLRLDPVLGLPLAPWWKRLLAILLDDVIIAVPVIVIVLIAFGQVVHGLEIDSTQFNSGVAVSSATLQRDNFIIWGLTFASQVLYFGLLNGSRRGQTVGMIALKIAVRDANTGGPIGFWRAAVRFGCFTIFEGPFGILRVLGLLYLIDCLAPLWDSRRQAWHDHIVRSVVIELPG